MPPYDPDKHHRRSLRLKGYDYAQPGAYFVTIVTQNRARLFGQVVDGVMQMNDAGRMVQRWWDELNRKFPHVRTDAFVVMPNHSHGIIVIQPAGQNQSAGTNQPVRADKPVGADQPVGADLRVRPYYGDRGARRGAHTGAPLRPPQRAPLPKIVQWFKTMTTNEYIRHVNNDGWAPFNKRLWQRNYYEHIIRDDDSLHRIRQYIAENPLRWHLDRENPNNSGEDDNWNTLFHP